MTQINSVEIDLSEVVEELPPGDYKVCIANVEQKTSKAGNAYLKWQLTVVDHSDARFNGKYVWTNTMLSGKGAFALIALAKAALGSKLEKGATRFNPQDVLGKTVIATVVPGEDQNGGASGFPEVKAVRAVA